MSCEFVPPHVEQLHGPDPTAGSDCAIAVAKMAIRFATCGTLDPGMDAIRAQAGLDEPNPPPSDFSTTMTEYARCLNSYDDEARSRGYDGIGAGVHERESWEDQLAPLIRQEEKWACVFVSYSVLNDREPGKSGDPNFNGAHAIGVFGFVPAEESGDGNPKVKVFDPLCDGRKSSIPKGPTWWQMSTLRDAADAYSGGGSGTATWTATPRSKLLDPEQPPEPPDPCAMAVTSSRELLGELRTFLWLMRYSRPRRDHEREAAYLFGRISDYLGGNAEGLTLPVHEGVKPDHG